MKTLYLLRHAKSSWKLPAASDLHRPLAPRGQRDARRMGRWLARQPLHLDGIVLSPSVRTRETLGILAEHLPLDTTSLDVRDALYLAPAEQLVTELQALPDTWDEALLLGHNPGLADLAEHLLPGTALPMPTCACLGLRLPLEHWAQLGAPGAAPNRLLFYAVPRQLKAAEAKRK